MWPNIRMSEGAIWSLLYLVTLAVAVYMAVIAMGNRHEFRMACIENGGTVQGVRAQCVQSRETAE